MVIVQNCLNYHHTQKRYRSIDIPCVFIKLLVGEVEKGRNRGVKKFGENFIFILRVKNAKISKDISTIKK